MAYATPRVCTSTLYLAFPMTTLRNDTFLRLPVIKQHAALSIDLANQYCQAKLLQRMLHFRSFPELVLFSFLPQSEHFVFPVETRIQS